MVRELMAKSNYLARKVAVILLRGYQLLVSPLFGPCCRYSPSCSCYTYHAIERFGVVKGGWLAIKRLAKCHPFMRGGYDPVPESKKREHKKWIKN